MARSLRRTTHTNRFGDYTPDPGLEREVVSLDYASKIIVNADT